MNKQAKTHWATYTLTPQPFPVVSLGTKTHLHKWRRYPLNVYPPSTPTPSPSRSQNRSLTAFTFLHRLAYTSFPPQPTTRVFILSNIFYLAWPTEFPPTNIPLLPPTYYYLSFIIIIMLHPFIFRTVFLSSVLTFKFLHLNYPYSHFPPSFH